MYQYNAQAPVSPNNWRAYNTEVADHWTGAKYSCDIMLSNLGYFKKNRCVFYFVIWMSHTRANYDEWCSSQKNAINLHASVHGRDGISLAPCEAQPTISLVDKNGCFVCCTHHRNARAKVVYVEREWGAFKFLPSTRWVLWHTFYILSEQSIRI